MLLIKSLPICVIVLLRYLKNIVNEFKNNKYYNGRKLVKNPFIFKLEQINYINYAIIKHKL